MTSINFIDEEECSKHSDSLKIPDFRDIYHGCMSREVSVKTLKASCENNSYLVRKRINAEEDENTVEYILSFLNDDDDYHFKIKKENRYFVFANRYFPSFKCIISHYMLSNIINDAHLEFGVVNKTITAVRESLRGLSCYLVDNISNDRIIELLHRNGPGSYLFRPRTDDNNQFVLMFFDGMKIHKLKMDVQVLEKKSMTDKEITETVVVLVLGRNFFESWMEMVENFNKNPIVKVDAPGCQDKLVTAVDVNAQIPEGDIYRMIKFSHALQPKDVYSVHGEIRLLEVGSKKKWKLYSGSVDKEHGHLIIKNSKVTLPVMDLIGYNFIPIHYSVYQKYCFLLVSKDQNSVHKSYYISMADPATSNSSTYDRRDMSEEAYAFRPYNLVEYDKEVYHSTESELSDNSDSLLRRAFDRWMVAIKRHCRNTKDDVANEENPERHSKLYRYNRRLKLSVGHSGGPEIALVDSDISLSPSLSTSTSTSQSTQNLQTNGQFEVMLGKYLIAVLPRIKDGNTQTLIFQDLPSNLNDVSVVFRIKSSKRKEYTKELCNFTMVHQELVPRPIVPNQLSNTPIEADPVSTQSTCNNLATSSIQTDPPSSCGPITVDCFASIDYREFTILPFNNYAALSRHIMDNMRSIFMNSEFAKLFKKAVDMNENKKLFNCFLYMAIWEKKQVEFLFLFFEEELKDLASNMYFRTNTNASRVFCDYVFQFASDWIVCSLLRLFEELHLSTNLLKNPEANGDENSAIDPNEQVKSQIDEDTTQKCLVAAVDGITDNLKYCPLTLRALFNLIQTEIERLHHINDTNTDNFKNEENPDGLRYRVLTNLVLFRFFCAVLNSRGERQDEYMRKISENIRKKKDANLTNFPKAFTPHGSLNDFLVKISRLIVRIYSPIKNKEPSEFFSPWMEDYRDKTIKAFNVELTKPLTPKEKEAMIQQLETESQTICRLSSLSRRFNEVLEFLTVLQEQPSNILKSIKGQEKINRNNKSHVISQELSTIIEEINSKKSCNNQTLIERL